MKKELFFFIISNIIIFSFINNPSVSNNLIYGVKIGEKNTYELKYLLDEGNKLERNVTIINEIGNELNITLSKGVQVTTEVTSINEDTSEIKCKNKYGEIISQEGNCEFISQKYENLSSLEQYITTMKAQYGDNNFTGVIEGNYFTYSLKIFTYFYIFLFKIKFNWKSGWISDKNTTVQYIDGLLFSQTVWSIIEFEKEGKINSFYLFPLIFIFIIYSLKKKIV